MKDVITGQEEKSDSTKKKLHWMITGLIAGVIIGIIITRFISQKNSPDHRANTVLAHLACLGCNCGLTLDKCECGHVRDVKQLVYQFTSSGMDEDSVYRHLIQQYGFAIIADKDTRMKYTDREMLPRISVEPASFDFGIIKPETVAHSFIVSNKGKGVLEINKVYTSCGCTTAELRKNRLEPGESAEMLVKFNPKFHPMKGKVMRVVYMESNDVEEPVKEIKIEAEISE